MDHVPPVLPLNIIITLIIYVILASLTVLPAQIYNLVTNVSSPITSTLSQRLANPQIVLLMKLSRTEIVIVLMALIESVEFVECANLISFIILTFNIVKNAQTIVLNAPIKSCVHNANSTSNSKMDNVNSISTASNKVLHSSVKILL